MSAPASAPTAAAAGDQVTFRVAGQWLGLPVGDVQEVLRAQRLAPVPLAPPAVAGFLNLRGQTVTALDLRAAFGVGPAPHGPAGDPPDCYDVVVRDEDELFALVVDEVGDVAPVDPAEVEPPPATLGTAWRSACTGAVRRSHDVLLLLDLPRLLGHDRPAVARAA